MLMQPLILLWISILQVYANTEANENKKLNQTDVIDEKVNQDITLDPLVDTITNEKDNLAQTQRQKRNGYNYDEPYYYNPYPSYRENGGYGDGNKLEEISKRLKDLMMNVHKRAFFTPPPTIQPVFVPYFVPSIRCLCNTASQVPPSTATTKPQSIPTQPPIIHTESPTTSIPDFTSRMGDDDDDDGVRLITFDTILSKKPLNRESPPVEHGTVQAGAVPSVVKPSGVKPSGTKPSGTKPSGTKPSGALPSGALPSQSDIIPPARFPSTPGESKVDRPTTELVLSDCDIAITRCCFQPRITYTCFKSENCLNPPFRSNLCEKDILQNVLVKYIRVLQDKGV